MSSNQECIKKLRNLLQNHENVLKDDLVVMLDDFLQKHVEAISLEIILIFLKFTGSNNYNVNFKNNYLKQKLYEILESQLSEKKYFNAILLSRLYLENTIIESELYYNVAEILIELKNFKLSLEFVKEYKKKEINLPLKLLTLAQYYNLKLRDYKLAIKYYEEYLKIDETKASIYNILANLYAKEYGDKSLNEQICYYNKALKLLPNDRLALHGLAFSYEKIKDINKANYFYKLLLENTPTAVDKYNYGTFLISCGDFVNGHKFLTNRFLTGDENLKYPEKLDFKKKYNFTDNIANKIMLVHYEQGFGDTIMYCRYLQELKKKCKKVIFIVQNELLNLILNSPKVSKDIEIISSNNVDYSTLVYDYSLALLDVPYVVGATSDDIIFSEGYLKVSEANIEQYKLKNIKNNKKLKIGISCCGDKTANYKERDIKISSLNLIFNSVDADFYYLGKDIVNNSNLIALGNTFDNFSDTSYAIKNMDYVISTDNVILNLAGALGVKTIGLFTTNPNFRWFKLKNDVGWYKSVSPIINTNESNLYLNQIIKILSKSN